MIVSIKLGGYFTFKCLRYAIP